MLVRKMMAVAVTIMLATSILAVTGCDNAADGENSIPSSWKEIPGKNIMMCDHEVTQAEWKEILDWAKANDAAKTKYPEIIKADSRPSKFSSSPESGETQSNRPVEMVTWYDAVMYCNLLTMREMGESECAYNITAITYNGDSYSYIESATVSEVNGKKGYRLPKQDEWEYAGRAGNTATGGNQYGNPDPTGANLGNYAWYESNSGNKTHEVKKKTANDYGLYDMSGNVWEWCWDTSGADRVRRGGCWDSSAAYCVVSDPRYNTPGYRDSIIGFRIVCRN